MAATVLPLTQTILDTYKNELYQYLIKVEFLTVHENINIDEYGVSCQWYLDLTRKGAAQKYSRMSYNAFVKPVVAEVEKVADEFVVLMPQHVWQKWLEFLWTKSSRSWNSWTKLFCYVYFNAAKHTGCSFTHSREQFQTALGMNAADISKKLIELEEAKFISRTNYNADQGIARAYLLNDRLWPSYRLKEIERLKK